MGFFLLFIYKDFVIREVVSNVKEQIPDDKCLRALSQIETDYTQFVESELVEWVHLMLSLGVFQSYKSVVIPNEGSSPDLFALGTPIINKPGDIGTCK